MKRYILFSAAMTVAFMASFFLLVDRTPRPVVQSITLEPWPHEPPMPGRPPR